MDRHGRRRDAAAARVTHETATDGPLGPLRLCDVAVGGRARVVDVAHGDAGQGRRLEDLGLLVGTPITVERRAPLGDPTIYQPRGARLALRRADAALVSVETLPAATGAPA